MYTNYCFCSELLQTGIHHLPLEGNYCKQNVWHTSKGLYPLSTRLIKHWGYDSSWFLQLISRQFLWRSLSKTVMDISHLIIQKTTCGSECDPYHSTGSAGVFLKTTCTWSIIAFYGLLNSRYSSNYATKDTLKRCRKQFGCHFEYAAKVT